MSAKTDGERLERVETSLENLEKLVTEQARTLKEIRDNQMINSANSASKEYVDTRISSVEIKIESSKRKTSFQTWVTGTLSAVLGGILSLLVAFFIANIGK